METCDNGCEHGYIEKQDNKIIGTSRVYDRKVLIVVYRVRELTASAKVALAVFPTLLVSCAQIAPYLYLLQLFLIVGSHYRTPILKISLLKRLLPFCCLATLTP